MIFFVLAGLCTFLAGTLWLEASRAAPWLGEGRWPRITILVVAMVVLGALLFMLYTSDGELVPSQVLHSSRVFRMVLGGLCGLMLALFLGRGGRMEGAQANASSASAAPAPWWARSVGLMPVAVLVLVAYAALVPRGEVNLGIIRSFKTPLIEAQFTQTQSEANLRLAIEGETQGFFRLNRAGLDEALNLARAELYYLRTIARATGQRSQETKARETKARDALEQELTFLLAVLQPAALCVQQSFALYGSQSIFADALQKYGAAFSRALVLAKKADPGAGDDDPFAEQALQELTESIEMLKHERLRQRRAFRAMPEYEGDLCYRASDQEEPPTAEVSPGSAGSGASGVAELEDIKNSNVSQRGHPHDARVALESKDVALQQKLAGVSTGSAGSGASNAEPEKLAAFHRGDPRDALRAFRPKAVAELIQRPSVIHGIAVFFLWSGDPGAAEKILSQSSSEFYDDKNPYPGVLYLSGFVERWLRHPSSIDPDAYLSLWRKTIELFEQRLENLRGKANYLVGSCTSDSLDKEDKLGKENSNEVFLFAAKDLDISPAVARTLQPPVACMEGNVAQCEARLAYGYFTHFVQKLRNHVVYESARELLAEENIQDADVILHSALQIAGDLLGFVDANGYRRGNCRTLQMTGVIGGPEGVEEKVTTNTVAKDYAFFRDSAGLIRYAKGVQHRSDEDYSAALSLFDQALIAVADKRYAAGRAVIEEHRMNALRALGVPD
jgi:hypothetical protein